MKKIVVALLVLLVLSTAATATGLEAGWTHRHRVHAGSEIVIPIPLPPIDGPISLATPGPIVIFAEK